MALMLLAITPVPRDETSVIVLVPRPSGCLHLLRQSAAAETRIPVLSSLTFTIILLELHPSGDNSSRTPSCRARWNDPLCIRCRNKECLLLNATLVLRSLIPDFSDRFGDPDGTLLLNFDGSEGSQDLQLAPRDSRGEPLIPGPKNSEQDPLEQECESECNTLILPLKKQNGKEYRSVQDLRAVNQVVQDIHPVVANPYTLPTSLKEKHKWFTVLDLKDAFFCIPLDKDSQAYLPLDGKAPPLDARQLTWTVLPQGFKNSPTILGNQLAKELEVWKKENSEGIILRYVDDILIAAETQEDCLQVTISLFNFWDKQDTEYQKARPRLGKRL
ncbi:hypothetical protein QYF61_027808 [Mycteria americana]|uniref:ribonuclease H n=1 Tax=Mycteria americana TaxID=33587 RepID=A0AAN7RSN2_MYCAM|nr:hypothetical protein QYF61_027808 [Mycteria americana]